MHFQSLAAFAVLASMVAAAPRPSATEPSLTIPSLSYGTGTSIPGVGQSAGGASYNPTKDAGHVGGGGHNSFGQAAGGVSAGTTGVAVGGGAHATAGPFKGDGIEGGYSYGKNGPHAVIGATFDGTHYVFQFGSKDHPTPNGPDASANYNPSKDTDGAKATKTVTIPASIAHETGSASGKPWGSGGIFFPHGLGSFPSESLTKVFKPEQLATPAPHA